MRASRGLACALLIIGACRRNPPERANGTASSGAARSSVLVTAAAQDTGFAGATSAVHRARPRAPTGILRAARAATHPGYDRVVFEFAGDSLPGYQVEYATRPVVRCGSGDPVVVAGANRLRIRFEPAQAHDDRGQLTVVEREMAPGLPAVKEMKLVCDFEGQVEWVLGVAAASPYRILETAAPGRLVLDLRHGP